MTKNEYINKLKQLYNNKFSLLTDKENYTNRDKVNLFCNDCQTELQNINVRHSIRTGNLRCPTCYNRFMIQQAQDKIDIEYKNDWKITEYKNGIFYALHKCGGYKKSNYAKDFAKTCPNCNKYVIRDKKIDDIIEKYKGIFSFKYLDHNRLIMKCQNNHEYGIDLNRFLKKPECKYCNGFSDSMTLEEYRKALKQIRPDYEVIDFAPRKYKDVSYDKRFIKVCYKPINYVFITNKNTLLTRRSNIEVAYLNYLKLKDRIKDELNGVLVTSFKAYKKMEHHKKELYAIIDHKTKKIIYDPREKKYKIKTSRYKSRGICYIFHTFNKHRIFFKTEKEIKLHDNLVRRFDIHLSKYNLFIEYDGMQHFNNTNFSKSNDMTNLLENRFMSDFLKNQYCIDKNINLLRIPYTLNEENITNIINELIENHFDLESLLKKYNYLYGVTNNTEYNYHNYYEPVINNLTEKFPNWSGNPLELQVLIENSKNLED